MTPNAWPNQTNLNTRQPDLSVLTDQVHKPRNLSAIIRSCDAFGLASMHVVWPREGFRAFRKTAGGSYNWVTTHTHPTMDEAVSELKGRGTNSTPPSCRTERLITGKWISPCPAR